MMEMFQKKKSFYQKNLGGTITANLRGKTINNYEISNVQTNKEQIQNAPELLYYIYLAFTEN